MINDWDNNVINIRVNHKPTKDNRDKDNKIKNILSKMKHYKGGDSVDLYLKNCVIGNYTPDTYVVNTDKMALLVNICNKTITNTKKNNRIWMLMRKR